MIQTRQCKICSNNFTKDITPKQLSNGRGQYCSRQCAVVGTGNLMKCNNSGSNHYLWRGDDVGYNGLHSWVRRHKPITELCEECQLKPPIDLANKGVYNRDFSNWEYLCRKCHMTKDGRLEKTKTTRFKKGHISWNKGISIYAN